MRAQQSAFIPGHGFTGHDGYTYSDDEYGGADDDDELDDLNDGSHAATNSDQFHQMPASRRHSMATQSRPLPHSPPSESRPRKAGRANSFAGTTNSSSGRQRISKSTTNNKSQDRGTGGRKKATRACSHCQKAHLTCDDQRPCHRCIKRGMAVSCTDGRRKKAKYLRDYDDDVVERRVSATTQAEQTSTNSLGLSGAQTTYSQPINTFGAQGPAPLAASASQPTFESLDLNDFAAPANDFGSHAANLEYAVLSSMLDESRLSGGLPPSVFQGNSSSEPNMAQPTPNPLLHAQKSNRLNFTLTPDAPKASDQLQSSGTEQEAQEHDDTAEGFAFKPITKPTIQPQPLMTTGLGVMRVEDVYNLVNKPYPYTKSYHHLIRHIKESRFEKADILRIVRALAIFRPSLIALQIPLTEEDEVFVERCFQRTLIEYDKLISLSGTPTVVWRRTCEICLVGTEFCLLTEWSRETLIGENKFIFELFDSASTVEYYEQFATHAFENTSQAVTMACTILTPSGRPVPCSFCFTIQRDLFNLPSLIVGSFLPVLA